MADLNITITLSTRTCRQCATVFAVPNWAGYVQCPICAGRRMSQLERENRRYEQRISNYRGSATRANNRAKKAEAALRIAQQPQH